MKKYMLIVALVLVGFLSSSAHAELIFLDRDDLGDRTIILIGPKLGTVEMCDPGTLADVFEAVAIKRGAPAVHLTVAVSSNANNGAGDRYQLGAFEGCGIDDKIKYVAEKL